MKIVAICGAGIGTSGILKVNAERVLQRLGITATVVACDLDSLAAEADDAQVILTSPEFVDAIGTTFGRRDRGAELLRHGGAHREAREVAGVARVTSLG